ncbi:hypothetical protein Pan241w_11120 [Gimesia alba]|uniref:Sulfotransferase family protein n=1 Tax=Gimesia alba TaxID=2527973 RepID=A0A517RB81_9PLAN|nr:hypothetical protein [Gimesia alba]QDT41053.1 hypothetical protein Pan241w_11120 [Gimesia alba]
MLVNHDIQFTFIHAGKCAGIALSQWLLNHYDFEYYGDPDAKIPGTKIVERHRFVIPDELKGYKVITSVREPFARWESFYLYQNLVMGFDIPFGQFTRERLDWISKQSEYTCQADYVLRVESLAEDVLKLPFVKQPVPEIPRLNVSRDQARYDEIRSRIVWTIELRSLVAEHFKEDFDY